MATRRIMIVEDDIDLRSTLKDLLELFGYSVITAENGREALDLLEGDEHPCLLLLDLMMPVMNGWEFLDTLKQQSPSALKKIPIIVSSAAADLANIEEEYGCRVMRKPLDIKQLASIAKQHCCH